MTNATSEKARVPERAYKGMGMEGFVATWYARLTRKSLEEFRELARRTAAELPAGAAVLEVAPGPGYFALELARLGGCRVTGLDVSQTFVEIASRNAREQGVEVDFRLGNASAMPFEDETFDFVFCRAAFKNFAQPLQALGEMYRVLKPGGQAVIIDLRRDTSRDAVYQAVDDMGLDRLDTIFTKLTFRWMLLKRAYTKSEFESFVAQTRFRVDEIRGSATGLEARLEK